MRQATRVILHDAALDIVVNDATGPVHWSERRLAPSTALADWLSWWGRSTFTKFPPVDDLRLVYSYRIPENDVTQIQAEIKAPGYLEMAVTYRDGDGNEWTEHGAYCGAFEVWWADD